ncbi:MAG: hypothetical protein IKV43_00485 [Clostridia bacterium]|nr:hypothetical protein [Clostridia bacterium]
MKKVKIILLSLLSVVAILLPFFSVFAVVLATPPQYSDTFVGVLDEKYERLHSIEEEKIVVVGGSSVAFGLDSAALESYTGMPVVNFGLYAALGTKLMLDLSDSGINKGDIVILAPELDPQTLSMYFNSRTTLEAIDDNYKMMLDIGVDNWFNLFGGMWSFAGDKLKRASSDTPVILDKVYRAENINEYGDFSMPRPVNTMAMWYDPNTPVELTTDVLGADFDEFCDYLNMYIAKLKLKGAKVYFSYCPINEMALTENTTDATKAEFVKRLEESINCDFISDIDDYILDAGYFFDTNFHLNDAGVTVRTGRLAKDLIARDELDVVGVPIADEPNAPALPGYEILYMGAEDPNAKYFTYEVIENGAYAGAYTITGLSELGKTQTELTIPVGADGLRVISIGANAFADGNVKRLSITENTSLKLFENGSFAASGIEAMYFYTTEFPYIAPPADFYGVSLDFVLHIPSGMNVSGLYEWSQRGLVIRDDVTK